MGSVMSGLVSGLLNHRNTKPPSCILLKVHHIKLLITPNRGIGVNSLATAKSAILATKLTKNGKRFGLSGDGKDVNNNCGLVRSKRRTYDVFYQNGRWETGINHICNEHSHKTFSEGIKPIAVDLHKHVFLLVFIILVCLTY